MHFLSKTASALTLSSIFKNTFICCIFYFSFFSTTTLSAENTNLKAKKTLSSTADIADTLTAAQDKTTRSIITIEAKKRADDYLKAYLLIRQSNPSSRIFFKLANGTTLINIADVAVLENGTLMLFKTTTTQGLKNDVIPVEEIISLGHL